MAAFAALRSETKTWAPELLASLKQRLSPRPKPEWHCLNHGAYTLISDAQVYREGAWYLLGDLRLDNGAALAATLGLPATTADFALILAAWRRWGETMAAQLEGDFALLLLCPDQDTVFALRDAVGTKPLYYHRSGDLLALSNSTRALALLPGLEARLSRRGLLMWLHNHYDDRVTLFEQIHGLNWGEALSYHSGQLRCWRWWQPKAIERLRLRDPREYGELWRETLARCVADRCRGSVIGTHLSGGLDSSSVTALAAHYADKHSLVLIPYSHSFPTLPNCDERELSLAAAQHLKLGEPHWIDAEAHLFLEAELMDGRQRETPFLGFSSINAAILKDLAERGGTTLLSGHGGDNMSSGITATSLLLGQAQRLNLSAARRLLSEHRFSPATLLWRLFLEPMLPKAARDWRISRYQAPKRWLSPSAQKAWQDERDFFRNPIQSWYIDRQASYDMLIAQANGIRRVIQADARQAQAFGIEEYFPYFDRRMIEMVLSIPPEALQKGPLSKDICRTQMKGILPDMLIETHSKPHIGAFYHTSMTKQKDRLHSLMINSRLADMGLIDPKRFIQEIQEFLNGSPEVIASFYTVIMLENWLFNLSQS